MNMTTLTLSDSSNSLCADGGEIVLLTGDSGSGKSLWLECLAGLNKAPEQISIELTTQAHKKPVVRMIFDRWPILWLGQNVAEELALGLERAPDRSETERALARWRLDALTPETETASLHRLQALRLSLAAATLVAPDLLLLDNPTASLSRSDAESVIHDIKSEAQFGNTIIVVACNRWHDWGTSATQVWQTTTTAALPKPISGDYDD